MAPKIKRVQSLNRLFVQLTIIARNADPAYYSFLPLILQYPPSGADRSYLYTTEVAAQKHCPKDTVVWLNLPSCIYHFKGQRWCANTIRGAFVCQQEADRTGSTQHKPDNRVWLL